MRVHNTQLLLFEIHSDSLELETYYLIAQGGVIKEHCCSNNIPARAIKSLSQARLKKDLTGLQPKFGNGLTILVNN